MSRHSGQIPDSRLWVVRFLPGLQVREKPPFHSASQAVQLELKRIRFPSNRNALDFLASLDCCFKHFCQFFHPPTPVCLPPSPRAGCARSRAGSLLPLAWGRRSPTWRPSRRSWTSPGAPIGPRPPSTAPPRPAARSPMPPPLASKRCASILFQHILVCGFQLENAILLLLNGVCVIFILMEVHAAYQLSFVHQVKHFYEEKHILRRQTHITVCGKAREPALIGKT